MSCITIAVLALTASLSWAAPVQIVIIRHAEKPDAGSGLSEKGLERARALAGFFKQAAPPLSGVPAAVYAMDPKDPEGSQRPIQTVAPLAQSLGLTINADFKKGQIPQLVKAVMADPGADGRSVLISWEHNMIPKIVEALGWDSAPKKWPGAVFDRVWVLNFKDGAPVSFQDAAQHLLPGDSAR